MTDHRYLISFPGGEIIYLPLEGNIIDQTSRRTVNLPEKRKYSVLSAGRSERGITISDFKPVCLTIYPGHHCNLKCTYCYIPDKEKYPEVFIDPVVVESGAELTAVNCRERKMPFVAGFHGGNEPLLNPGELEKYLEICRKIARIYNLEFQSFCTTNGVIPESTARWAAYNFSGITLSWDGPPEIHDAYRRDEYHKITSKRVEQTVRIFSEMKGISGNFKIRCTVSSLSAGKLEEIVRYFRTAGAGIVEFYPLFQNRDRTLSQELIPDPALFVWSFLKARSYGSVNGMNVLFSGSRINEYHNRFCMTLQDNLTVTPDGYITNCFYHTFNFNRQDDLFFYGKYNSENGRLEFDHQALSKIIKKYGEELSVCSDCFNQFHCSHGCPDICPYNGEYNISSIPGCTAQKWLGLADILENTGYLKIFKNETECSDFFGNISCERI
jgi:uncharacterized protein